MRGFSVKINKYLKGVIIFSLIKCQCCRHIETSQLICRANQLTGFTIRGTLALSGLIRFLRNILL